MNGRRLTWMPWRPALIGAGVLVAFGAVLAYQPATAKNKKKNGSTWTLPYFGSASAPGANTFEADNTGAGGTAIAGVSTNGGIGTYGSSNSYYGVYGTTSGTNSGSITAAAIYGTTSTGVGVAGLTSAAGAPGVYGSNSAAGGNALYGTSTASSGSGAGVYGTTNSSSGYGIYGQNNVAGGNAIYGYNNSTTGAGAGVYGTTASSAGYGVYGLNSTAGGNAIYGNNSATSGSGAGVYATTGSSTGNALYAVNTNGGYGVYGYSTRSDGYGTIGVYGTSLNVGVYGSGQLYGVEGICTSSFSTSAGVKGWAQTSGSLAGLFVGPVSIQTGSSTSLGNLSVDGAITAGTKDFRIDHPLDPTNKYLRHSCVESNERMNIYNGIITLDNDGKAVVQMPRWFEALNREFRYQLTCIGGFAPVYISKELENNYFEIAGGKANMKISWQITGVRHDVFANAHPLIVEPEKSPSERGKYLYPIEAGKPVSMGIHFSKSIKVPTLKGITMPASSPVMLKAPIPPASSASATHAAGTRQ